jgi:hypothetical protein
MIGLIRHNAVVVQWIERLTPNESMQVRFLPMAHFIFSSSLSCYDFLMKKDFDCWNMLKKHIHNGNDPIFCNEREIWWSSIGINVGSEEDGKNNLYERPIIVLKVLNKSMILCVPLTSKIRNDKKNVQVR